MKKQHGFYTGESRFSDCTYLFVVGAAMDDSGYSSIDEEYFSNPTMDCDQVKNSGACETYMAK